jgi:hypothetical protein
MFTKLLRLSFRRPTRTTRRCPQVRTRLGVECLEDRSVPSAAAITVTATLTPAVPVAEPAVLVSAKDASNVGGIAASSLAGTTDSITAPAAGLFVGFQINLNGADALAGPTLGLATGVSTATGGVVSTMPA